MVAMPNSDELIYTPGTYVYNKHYKGVFIASPHPKACDSGALIHVKSILPSEGLEIWLWTKNLSAATEEQIADTFARLLKGEVVNPGLIGEA